MLHLNHHQPYPYRSDVVPTDSIEIVYTVDSELILDSAYFFHYQHGKLKASIFLNLDPFLFDSD